MPRKAWEHIFKVQIPIVSNVIEPDALVYNEDRSILEEVPVTMELQELFPPGVAKIYVKGTYNQKGEIDLQEVVEDQPW